MMKIQVLGKGLIPRGMGLAPHKSPFLADKNLISTIVNTPGLTVNMFHPEDGRLIPITAQNLDKMWKSYGNIPLPRERRNVVKDVPKTLIDINNEELANKVPPKVLEMNVNNERKGISNSNKKEVSDALIKNAVSTIAKEVIKVENAEKENKDIKAEDKNKKTFRPVNSPEAKPETK